MPSSRALTYALALSGGALTSAHNIIGVSWCANDTTAAACHKHGAIGNAIIFNVALDLSSPREHHITWGTTPSEYVVAQTNATVTPSVILEENDSLLWMSGDGKGHWFDIDELDEIDYWGPPFELDTGLIGYSSEPNCLWAVYRNYSEATGTSIETKGTKVSVGDIDSGSMSLIPLFTVDGVHGDGRAFVSDSYVSMLLWTETDGFTLVEKPKSCYQRKESSGTKAVEKTLESDHSSTQDSFTRGARPLAAHGCEGGVVAMSWPWGWPTNDTLFVVVTQLNSTTYHANKYDTSQESCTLGYEFTLPEGAVDNVGRLFCSYCCVPPPNPQFFGACCGVGRVCHAHCYSHAICQMKSRFNGWTPCTGWWCTRRKLCCTRSPTTVCAV